jgi:hypothetical protein
MWRRIGMVLLLVLAPAVGRAQEAPEDLLPGGTQVYLRWDGVAAHRAAYEQSALGKTLAGDTGTFVRSVFDELQDLLGGAVVQELLKGTPPEKLQKIQDEAAKAPKLVGVLAKHGIILGVHVRNAIPPDAQVTLILPDAGDEAGPFLATLRLAASLTKLEIQERQIEGRTVYALADSPVPLTWWVEGKHVVFTGGTSLPESVIKRVAARKDRLTDSPLFKKVSGFKEFETGTRAFVDTASLGRVGVAAHKDVGKLLADTGLDRIQSVTLYSGFDGPAEHGIMELELSGERTGLLRLLGGKPFRLADVPVLPADAVNWSATNFDPKVAFDEGIRTAEGVVRVVAPDELPKLREGLKQLDDLLGVSVRKELLEALGDRYVQYTSPTDGPLFFGQTVLVQVKDPEKLEAALEQAIKGIGKVANIEVSTKKRTYHGATLHEVHVRQQGFIFVPTYTIHKGWLAFSYYPQAVQSYVLRAEGQLPAWKPDGHTHEALEKLPKEFVSISVSDPRPMVKQLLALAPLIGAGVNSALPDSKFDVGLIPNGHEATRHLFPNVAVSTVDDHALRLETRASLALPLALTNTDSVVVAELLVIFSFRFAAK